MPQQPHHIWQERLYARLFQQAYPLLVFDDGILPAASLWFSMREWVNIFRQHNLSAGSRILVALPPSRSFVAVLLAGLWERCSLALCPPSVNPLEAASLLDVSAIITANDAECTLSPHSAAQAPTPDVRLLLASSGTTSEPRWFALSDTNIFTVLDSHLPELGLQSSSQAHGEGVRVAGVLENLVQNYPAARVLSVLPLHHAFGLLIDFLPAFFAGAELVRDTKGGRDTEALLALAEAHSITHCSMVPLLVRRLAESERGRIFLCGLQGGVIGGAPVQEDIVPILRQTKLRVGYGQTEASPGITLGAPGVWAANYLGKTLPKPLGSDVRINADSVLEFRGANACIGAWTRARGFEALPPERWHSTGDIVQTSNDAALEGYFFVGRSDDNFKLANGRFIPAVHWEASIQAAFEEVRSCMIFTQNGETCSLVLGLAHVSEQSKEAWKRDCSLCCGVPVDFFDRILLLPFSDWLLTPKGSTDRRAMRLLAEKFVP
ncbi:MAG: long-chain fatty acid--CoA ligase [Candidatus Kapaibacterium sp.]|nr:MAG: long-chain fatty acid--CoA ligase [Candidatus Kapabacteria bacterium]